MMNGGQQLTDAKTYIQALSTANPLREPTIRAAIRLLDYPEGSRGLDAGCGIGLQAILLADAVGPIGHVTGLDASPELLRHAEMRVNESGFGTRITLREGDVNRLPFEDCTFDWVWSADCVGYPSTAQPAQSIGELVRVVKPGGSVTILAYSSQCILPGYPLIEARLNAACSAYIPIVKHRLPETHFMCALGWFREAGLENACARTLVGECSAPLTRDHRHALTSLFEMLWGEPQPGASEADLADYERLCRPESPDFILNRPDYYAFFTYTLFRGFVPGNTV